MNILLTSIISIIFMFNYVNTELTSVDSVVLEGGGAKGIAYIGVMKAFEKVGLYKNQTYLPKKYIGTSIGCLFSAIFALDISPSDMKNLLDKTDLEDAFFNYKVKDLYSFPIKTMNDIKFSNLLKLSNWIFTFLAAWADKKSPGLNTGEKYMKFIVDRILPLSPHSNKLQDNFTFKNLYDVTGHKLICIAARLDKVSTVEYSYKYTPDMPVVNAIFASGDLPFIFKPTHDIYNCPIIDGGIYRNFPVDYNDNDLLVSKTTLGFSLEQIPILDTSPCNYKNELNAPLYAELPILYYIQTLGDALISSKDVVTYSKDPRNKNRIIYLEPKTSAIKFDLGSEEKDDILRRAYWATLTYFNEHSNLINNSTIFNKMRILFNNTRNISELNLGFHNVDSNPWNKTKLLPKINNGIVISETKYVPNMYIIENNLEELLF